MRKFSIKIFNSFSIYYNHYLSTEFINARSARDSFKGDYPLEYCSRGFDKSAAKYNDGACTWWLDDKYHRVGKPAWIFSEVVFYYENGEMVK